MKELFKIQLVRKIATGLTVVILASLALVYTATANAEEAPILELQINGELKKLYSLAALPERILVPLFSGSREVIGVSEQQLISVTDKKDLLGVVVPTAGGFFGTVVNQSSKSPVYYQLSPSTKSSSKGSQTRKSVLGQVVAELSQSDLPLTHHCEDELHANTGQSPRVAKMVTISPDQNSWRELELFVVSSSEFSRDRTDDVVTAQVLSTVAAANLFFEPLQLKISLSGLQILRADNDPYLDAIRNQDADQMLKTVKNQWAGKIDIKRDAVVVFGTSNYKRYSLSNTVEATDIFGLSYTATACANQDFSVLFASQGSLDSKGELGLASTLAHELGHTLGMSHDKALYNQLPSLMHQTFTINPSGFSDYSIKEYLSFAGPGLAGGSCFSSIATPEVLAFEGGASETISIKEGERFSRVIKITGQSGSKISASNLMFGSLYDSEKTSFTFEPSFEVASKKIPLVTVKQKFVAKLIDGREITKEFVFNISDVNRAPVIESVRVARGGEIKLIVKVRDLDGDKVTLSKSSRFFLESLRGARNIRFTNGVLNFSWKPVQVVRGKTLNLGFTDLLGGETRYRTRL